MPNEIHSSCCDRDIGHSTRLAQIDETVRHATNLCNPVGETETVPVDACLYRTASYDVVSLFPLPLRDHSAVDGYALGQAGQIRHQIIGRTTAGEEAKQELKQGQALRIMTGAPVPKGTAAVVMQEHTIVENLTVQATFEVPPGDNIRRAGEDVSTMETLVQAGRELDARHTAILAASGYQSVSVARKVRVAILSTGNELRDAGVGMGNGSNFDTNRPMLKALLGNAAVEVTDLGILPDNLQKIATVLTDVSRTHDLIITSGGVSVGEEDHLKPAVAAAGGHISSWRMAIKPGKPVALGSIGKAVYLGLPGNPLACFVDFLLLARPMIRALSGAQARCLPALQANAGFSWERRPGRAEFFPVNMVGSSETGLPILEKTGRAGSARLMPLIEADGLGMVHADIRNVEPGSLLHFYPFRSGMGLNC